MDHRLNEILQNLTDRVVRMEKEYEVFIADKEDNIYYSKTTDGKKAQRYKVTLDEKNREVKCTDITVKDRPKSAKIIRQNEEVSQSNVRPSTAREK